MTERMLGVAEVAARIGVKIDTVYVMSSRGQLPEPDQTVNAGRTALWTAETIDAWNAQRRKR